MKLSTIKSYYCNFALCRRNTVNKGMLPCLQGKSHLCISRKGNPAAQSNFLIHVCGWERFIYSQGSVYCTYFLQQNRLTDRVNI
jgi:hypothetical protein